MCRNRGEKLICPFLFLVWGRVGCYLWLSIDKVAGKTPDFFLAIVAVKDEISIFVLAVGTGTNVILERIMIIWLNPLLLQGGWGRV